MYLVIYWPGYDCGYRGNGLTIYRLGRSGKVASTIAKSKES